MFVDVGTSRKPSTLPATTIMIALACIALMLWQVFKGAEARSDLLLTWGLVPTRLWALESAFQIAVLTPLSALFLHADWLHLVGNLVFLWLFGLATERVIGSARFASIFILCGLLANLLAAWRLAESASPIVGSSGAVAAVIGAYIILFPTARIGVMVPLGLYIQFIKVPALALIAFWFGFHVLYGVVGSALVNVAWGAHIAGFMLGCASALFVRATRR